MVFRDYTYSVLVVSGSREFCGRISSMLPASEYWPVTFAANGGEARRKVLDHSFDIILINSPLPDESGIRLAEELDDGNSGILLFVKNDIYDEVYARIYEKGVMVLPKPTSVQLISQTLRIICTVRERMKRMEEKQATVEEKIKEIRLVNKAKWLLIEKEGLSEKDAHRLIERRAMDERISKTKAARAVIATFEDK